LVDDGVTVVSPTPSTTHSPLCEQPESPCGTTTCGCDIETTLGENTKDPTTHWGSERIGHED